MRFVKNSVFHSRTKHIMVEAHWDREVVTDNIIHIDSVLTSDNAADILTKSLSRQIYYKQLLLIGLCSFEEFQN